MKRLIFTFSLSLLAFFGFSQVKYASENKKAIKYYEEARPLMKRVQYFEALTPLNKAVEKDPNFIEAWIAIGTASLKIGETSKGIVAYKKALTINPDYTRSVSIYYSLGEAYYKNGAYQDAIDFLESFLLKKSNDNKKKEAAEKYIASSKFAITAISNPYEYNQRPLKDHANYLKLQYFPVLTVDEKTLIFTARRGLKPQDDENIYISKKDESGNWSIPGSVSTNINTPLNEGACTISADGRTLIFTACTGRKGYGSCDLYISYKIGDTWLRPENMGSVIDSSSWDVQPSLSADGRGLYFISTRKGGVGGKDIWYAEKNTKGIWQPPINMGDVINSVKDEISPFIHVNGESLFYSSTGHLGMGGYDIFKTEKTNDSTWSTPLNLGYPLNDKDDQVSLYISSNGETGYYTVEQRTHNDWNSWLYQFDMPKELTVKKKSTFLSGTVKDAVTEKPISSEIKLYDFHSNKIKSFVKSDGQNGEYTIVLTEGNDYGMYVSKEGYFFKDFSFSYENLKVFDKELLNVALIPIQSGVHMILKNIYFEFDSFELKQASNSELEALLEFLSQNKSIKIEIQGFTDDQGNENYNLDLSTKRAETVFNYLIKKGVGTSRIQFRGYGSSNPAFPNDSDENRTKNRRIEFQVLH